MEGQFACQQFNKTITAFIFINLIPVDHKGRGSAAFSGSSAMLHSRPRPCQ